MRKLSPVLCLLTALGSTSLGCAPAEAEEIDLRQPMFVPLRLTEEHFEDLKLAAVQRGWTLKETVRRIGWEPQFADFVESLRQQYPWDFAGAKITPESRYMAFVGFRGAIPEQILRDSRIMGLRIDFRAHQGHTEQALLDQTIAVHHALRKVGYQDVTVSYDVETGLVEVELVPELDGLMVQGAALRLPPQATQPNVVVSLASALPSTNDTLYGGGILSTCTAAFMVSQGGTYGFVTAGHCGDSQSQKNWAAGSTSSGTTFMGEHQGQWGDFQWHTVNDDTPSNYFYDDISHIRQAQYLGSPVEGMTLCRLGKTTNKQCDEVYKVNVSSNGADCLVAMRNDKAEGGDSGGPWFSGGTIHGVHKGSKWIWFKDRDVFSQMKHVDEALGVFPVLTPPPPPPPEGNCDPNQCYESCGGGVCSGGFCHCY